MPIAVGTPATAAATPHTQEVPHGREEPSRRGSPGSSRSWEQGPRPIPLLAEDNKASHRELDEARTTEGDPRHPHTRAVPVEPGRIEEYVLRIHPFAATFLPGHKLVVELSNDEPMADEHNALLPPDAYLPVGRPVTHKIYRDAAHPSRLVLPFTTVRADGEPASG
ncbi:CocE/NonD family hydrolase C-terminal non-catalytic domain-containing protein [Streptomyces sp. NPDC048171]|uniref:CocE/NonD family hydrolase C-terminal non-catalytic domain-containing protein n=1 Tax=unclassified Streptomyces TaxID=2593676 RepID=UPI0031FE8D01